MLWGRLITYRACVASGDLRVPEHIADDCLLCACVRHSTRSPDDAKIKSKMLYASSREALRRALVGIAAEIQGTEFSEVAYESGTFPPPDRTTREH